MAILKDSGRLDWGSIPCEVQKGLAFGIRSIFGYSTLKRK